jgi:hypothetical protein
MRGSLTKYKYIVFYNLMRLKILIILVNIAHAQLSGWSAPQKVSLEVVIWYLG